MPQPAWLHQREAAEDRQHGERSLLVLSRRKARARGCSNTPASTARVARPATIRTDPATIACWWPRCRSSASAATTTRAIRRRSTTTRWCRAATACSAAAASPVTRRSMARTIRPVRRSCGNREAIMRHHIRPDDRTPAARRPRRPRTGSADAAAPDRSGVDRAQRVHGQVVRHRRLRRPRHVDRR